MKPGTWSEQYAVSLDMTLASSEFGSWSFVIFKVLLLAASRPTNVASLAVPYNKRGAVHYDQLYWDLPRLRGIPLNNGLTV